MLQSPPSTCGIFISHFRSDRVERHFERLKDETTGLIQWHFVLNHGTHLELETDFEIQPAGQLLPHRLREMVQNGGIRGGFVDTIFIPAAHSIGAGFLWVMEYDVDFSGHWSQLFNQFQYDDSDLLTTSLTSRVQDPDWYWWDQAVAPEGFDQSDMHRAFMPILRISAKYASVYASTIEHERWCGHYEFTIPTIAAHKGFTVQDIGGERYTNPEGWGEANYVNEPLHPNLTPGTFVFRPPFDFYFHEGPRRFKLNNKLYHPVKVLGWT